MTLKILQSVRSEENFRLFWAKVVRMDGELGVGDPVLPRRQKTPKCFETGVGKGDFPEDVDTKYR